MITYKEFIKDEKKDRLYKGNMGILTRDEILYDLEEIRYIFSDEISCDGLSEVEEKIRNYLFSVDYATEEEIAEYIDLD